MQFRASAVVLLSGMLGCKEPPAASPTPLPATAEDAGGVNDGSGAGGEDAGAVGETNSKPKKVGGKCEYDDAPGTATVSSIENDTTAGPNCKHARKVTLSFKPDGASKPPKDPDKAFVLNVGGVDFVAEGCLKQMRIVVGTKLQAVRHTMTAGTCSPIAYEVTSLSSPESIEKCVAHCR